MRKVLLRLVRLGLIAGFAATLMGFLAPWAPALEMLNHFRPFALVGAGSLLAVSLALGLRKLVIPSAVLFSVTLALFLAPLLYAAPKAPTAEPDFRIVTLNTWVEKGQTSEMVRFIEGTQADFVLLQEIGRIDRAALLRQLEPLYPHVFYDPRSRYGPAILSKRPWIDTGIIKTRGESPVAVWARFEHDGRAFAVASIHTANPFEPKGQVDDIDRLIEYARAQDGPIMMGGDFNLTPFSWKLAKLAHVTGLRWAQTFEASWPANKLGPLVLLDHVVASPEFALVRARIGAPVGSDHLPVIADLAFREPVEARL